MDAPSRESFNEAKFTLNSERFVETRLIQGVGQLIQQMTVKGVACKKVAGVSIAQGQEMIKRNDPSN